MAPKNKGKRARTSAQEVEDEDRHLTPPQDQYRFDSALAEEKFGTDMCNRPVLCEYFLKFVDPQEGRLAGVVAEIYRRGWQYLLEAPTRANLSWVREFYANFHSAEASVVHLRGKLVPISLAHLAGFLGMEPPMEEQMGEDGDYYSFLKSSITLELLERVKDRLTHPGSSWKLSKSLQPQVLLAPSLKLVTRAWSRVIFSYVWPTSHHSDLTIDSALLIYSIMEGRRVDLPLHIHRRMTVVHHGSVKHGLPFPSLITRLAQSCEVATEADDELEEDIPSVTAAGLAIKEAGGKKKVEATSSAANPLASVSSEIRQLRSYIDQKFAEAEQRRLESEERILREIRGLRLQRQPAPTIEIESESGEDGSESPGEDDGSDDDGAAEEEAEDDADEDDDGDDDDDDDDEGED